MIFQIFKGIYSKLQWTYSDDMDIMDLMRVQFSDTVRNWSGPLKSYIFV